MSASSGPARVVAWSTGGVGAAAIDAIRRRPDLELVGVWVHSPEKVGKDAGELGWGRADRRDRYQRRRRADRAEARLRGVFRERTGARCGRGARLPAAVGGRHQRRVDFVDKLGVSAGLLRAGLVQPARRGRQSRRRVVLRIGHLPGFRLRPTRAADGHSVEEHPQHHGQRGCAQRPLSGRRRDDGRHGFRSAARLRADAEDARIHRDGLEGTDISDRRGSRRRG